MLLQSAFLVLKGAQRLASPELIAWNIALLTECPVSDRSQSRNITLLWSDNFAWIRSVVEARNTIRPITEADKEPTK